MNGLSADQLAALRSQLQGLRESYGEKLAQKVDTIQSVWRELRIMPDGDERHTAISGLHRLVHTVAGSGATFGFPLAGEAARRAEILLKPLLRTAVVLTARQIEEIEAALAELAVAAASATVPTFEEDGAERGTSGVGAEEISPAKAAGRRTLLLTDQPNDPEWISSLQTFGYQVEVCRSADQLVAAAQAAAPLAILADCSTSPLDATAGGLPLSSALAMLQPEVDKAVPLLWSCRSGDLEARIQAVRLGGSAFFQQPVDADALLAKLDDLTVSTQAAPYRVLIVDDEPSLGRLFSLILSQAGMLTHVISDPLEIMSPLVDFRPDIILMDVYMPGCSGVELSAVIRQQEAYLGIPIIFLSVESDVAKQLEAMRQGGDDFLTKPVQPRQLVAAVTTRARRARVLQQHMERDSLTGLLNQNKIQEQLEIEMDRAKRMGHPLALAVLDVDNFKNVNEVHGHGTGDRALRSLARLLLQRVRQTDVVGRCGGEEFAIIMNGTDRASAARVLEKARHAFACLPHWNQGTEFKLSLSVGVATSPPHCDAASLTEAAKAALVQAKERGRNRVAVSDDASIFQQRHPL